MKKRNKINIKIKRYNYIKRYNIVKKCQMIYYQQME